MYFVLFWGFFSSFFSAESEWLDLIFFRFLLRLFELISTQSKIFGNIQKDVKNIASHTSFI